MARSAEETETMFVGKTIKTAKLNQVSTYEPTGLTLGFDDGTIIEIALDSVRYDMFSPSEGCLRIAQKEES